MPQRPSAKGRKRDRARKDSLAINNQSQDRGSVVFEAVSSPCRLARRLAGHFLWRAAVRPSQACIAADADARARSRSPGPPDRKSVVEGKSVSGRVDLGGRRIIQNKNTIKFLYHST